MYCNEFQNLLGQKHLFEALLFRFYFISAHDYLNCCYNVQWNKQLPYTWIYFETLVLQFNFVIFGNIWSICFFKTNLFLIIQTKLMEGEKAGIFSKAPDWKLLFLFEGALSGLTQFFATESPLKIMKNAFYFTSKAHFVLKIFKFMYWIFGHVSKQLDWKDNFNFKFYDVTAWLTNYFNKHVTQYLEN